MTRKARIGVIGAGWWAAANHLPVLKSNKDCAIVAVNRLGVAELDALQRKFEVPLGFEDYRAMLEQVPMDGVVISSPHVLHYEHAVAALAKGCHLLVEKPLTTTTADARDLMARADTAGKQVIVPYGWNFKAWTDKAHALIAAGQIGRIEHIVLQMASALEDLFAGQAMKETETHMFRPPPSTWADPERAGGYGWGQLVHALGLLFRIADLEPSGVFAVTGKSPTGVDYYDAAVVQFTNGATAAVSGSATVPKHLGNQIDLRLFGSEGMLMLDIERERLEVRRRDGRDTVVEMAPGSGAYECLEPLNTLVDICLGRQVENQSPGRIGMRAVEVLDALYRSADSGRLEKV
ncbi:MAG: Gfo/Idh/MocA family oxidoreductase [Hyphomicrobiales bacterium]|nr:Gfo/Idh/MocA family oxidoreductase [Hyphomicrobiales bacterium]MBV8440761.1 Gfo/Idh/MocA family oxidoreductase [Hyphomicrobiales bacterium]